LNPERKERKIDRKEQISMKECAYARGAIGREKTDEKKDVKRTAANKKIYVTL